VKTALIEEFGGPDKLLWKDVPTPKPLARELLVRVRAAPINLGSVKYRKGYVPRATLPAGVGVEFAGVVEAVGPGITRFKVGDRILGRVLNSLAGTPGAPGVERTPSVDAAPQMVRSMGGVAEYALAAESECFAIPGSLSFAEAAASCFGFEMAWHGLHTRGKLSKDEDVFVCPASGNVGFAAAQIARLLGRRVIVGTSTDEKKAMLEEALRPDMALNYSTDDLEKRVYEFTEGKGVQVVWDGNGKPTFDRTWRTLGMGGRIFLYAGNTPGDADITFEIRLLNRRRVTIVPVTSVDDLRPITLRSFETEILPRLGSRELGTPVSYQFPFTLDGLIEAEAQMEKREHIGRVVLVDDN
jgi:NADPH:quinone reductase-like Zn-dependent oxidoreductase